MPTQRPPWLGPLAAGAAVRIVAACYALGFHARDDYFHVLLPALRWLHDPSFDWDTSDLPGAGIRSHLLPRLVWLALRACQTVGITTPEAQLRTLYLLMGAYSLTLVPAMYHATLRHFDAPTAKRAAWLAALFFPFPYAGTRLLIEAVAMPPLCAAIAFMATPGKRTQWAGGALFGLACWWRFHVIAAAVGLAAALWVQTARQQRTWMDNARVKAGFLLTVLAQGAFDLWTTGTFLGPVWRNIQVNLHPHAGLSKSTAWGYCGLLLALTLPPATVWLAPRLWRASKGAPLAAAAFVTFVLVHSLIPHKEDRFLLPALPLYAILLAAALDRSTAGAAAATNAAGAATTAAAATTTAAAAAASAATTAGAAAAAATASAATTAGAANTTGTAGAAAGPAGVPGVPGASDTPKSWLTRTWPAARTYCAALAAAALLLAITSQSQANLREAVIALREDPAAKGVISVGPELQLYFLGNRDLPSRQAPHPDETFLHQSIVQLAAQEDAPPNRFLAYERDGHVLQVQLLLEGYVCSAPQKIEGWWLDRLLAKMNKKRNRRRSPVLLYRCDPPGLA